MTRWDEARTAAIPLVQLVAAVAACVAGVLGGALGGVLGGIAMLVIAAAVSWLIATDDSGLSPALWGGATVAVALGMMLGLGFALLFLGIRLDHRAVSFGIAVIGLLTAGVSVIPTRRCRRNVESPLEPSPFMSGPVVRTAVVLVLLVGTAIAVSVESDRRYRERQSYVVMSVIGQMVDGTGRRTVGIEVNNTTSSRVRLVMRLSISGRTSSQVPLTIAPHRRVVRPVVVPARATMRAQLFRADDPKHVFRSVRLGPAR